MSTVGDDESDDIFINVSHNAVTVWLRGEIDLANLDRFARWLEPLRSIDADVHLRMQGLDFISMRGASLIVELADQLGRDRVLVLHEPPRGLRMMVDKLWPTSRVRFAHDADGNALGESSLLRQRDAQGESLA